VVYLTLASNGDCLKPAVWVRGEARFGVTVVHTPAVLASKVPASIAANQGLPRNAERLCAEDCGCCHAFDCHSKAIRG